MTQPKTIATLPPIEEVQGDIPLSQRTGEPRRPWSVLLGAISAYLGAAALTFSYAWHWWRAVYPDSYAISARLIVWADPDPGKWLALTLEGVFAAVLVLAAGAVAVAGFQVWNGWRWARTGALIAFALTIGFTVLVNDWGYIGIGCAALTAVCAFLPVTSAYFRLWDQARSQRREHYRRPPHIFYGRLPRFR